MLGRLLLAWVRELSLPISAFEKRARRLLRAPPAARIRVAGGRGDHAKDEDDEDVVSNAMCHATMRKRRLLLACLRSLFLLRLSYDSSSNNNEASTISLMTTNRKPKKSPSNNFYHRNNHHLDNESTMTLTSEEIRAIRSLPFSGQFLFLLASKAS
jgi:hypothetical protein